MKANVAATLSKAIRTAHVSILRWLTLALFSYFGTVIVVKVLWGEAAKGFLIPTLSSDPDFWTVVVAIFGTTISPYLFIWQQEASAGYARGKVRKAPPKKAS